MVKIKFAAFAVTLVAAFALTASAQAAWRDSPAVKALYDKAKAEGQVMVWGTQQGEVDWIPKAFNALFPGIDVQWVGDNDIATKAIAEARAMGDLRENFEYKSARDRHEYLNARLASLHRDLGRGNVWHRDIRHRCRESGHRHAQECRQRCVRSRAHHAGHHAPGGGGGSFSAICAGSVACVRCAFHVSCSASSR